MTNDNSKPTKNELILDKYELYGMMGMLAVNQALDAAREEGRREGAIGFKNWYHDELRPMVLRSRGNKEGWKRLVTMSDEEQYDLYLQSLQKDKPKCTQHGFITFSGDDGITYCSCCGDKISI